MKDLVILADGEVGLTCARFLLEEYRADLGLIVTTCDNEISSLARDKAVPTYFYDSDAQLAVYIRQRGLAPDMGLLLWWPHIIREPLLKLPKAGFINTHPSFLPYNRGKHYSFWALVEQAPFGITLHKVNAGIDTGDIIVQRAIHYDWCDTGQTLATKARDAMTTLVCEFYPEIRAGLAQTIPQQLGTGSFHRSSELAGAIHIDLDKPNTARGVLNLLRAKMHDGLPSCTFDDDGATYEVKIEIRKVQ